MSKESKKRVEIWKKLEDREKGRREKEGVEEENI